MEETNLRQLRTWIILNFEVRWGREPRILFLSGDVVIPWSSVMRRGFEHGFHGLHGFFIGGVKTGGFGPIVRMHKIIREIRVIRVQ